MFRKLSEGLFLNAKDLSLFFFETSKGDFEKIGFSLNMIESL